MWWRDYYVGFGNVEMICVWSWDLLSSWLVMIVDLLIGGFYGIGLKYLIRLDII